MLDINSGAMLSGHVDTKNPTSFAPKIHSPKDAVEFSFRFGRRMQGSSIFTAPNWMVSKALDLDIAQRKVAEQVNKQAEFLPKEYRQGFKELAEYAENLIYAGKVHFSIQLNQEEEGDKQAGRPTGPTYGKDTIPFLSKVRVQLDEFQLGVEQGQLE